MPAATDGVLNRGVAVDRYSLQWRAAYIGCGAVVAMLGALARSPVEVSFAFVFICVLALSVWFFGAFLLWLARERPLDPIRQIVLRSPNALLSVLDRSLLFLTIPLFWSCFAPVKAMIPEITGFWADRSLAAIDRVIFLGNDPSAVTHAIFGDVATKVIDIVYASWIVLILVVSFLVAVLGDERTRGRFYLGWGLIWLVLGIGGAFALGSAGPIFGAKLGFGFDTLGARLEAINQTRPLVAVMTRDMLWINYQSGNATIGNGISAAPSLHCAIAFFLALVARGTRFFTAAVIYSIIIWIGSVHLGWHYFVDGLVSLIGVLGLWPVITRLVDQKDRSQSWSVILARPMHRKRERRHGDTLFR